MACSLFLGIWRCIVGVDDDNQEKETLPNNRDISPYYDTPPRSYVPTATSSCACVLPQIPASSYSDSWNSARTKLPEALNIYSVKPKAAIHSSAATRPEASIRTPGKSHEAGAQKPKLLAPSPLHTPDNSHEATAQKTNKAAPSPFPADFSLKRQAVDHGNDETSLQTLPSELSSSSSQPLPSLTKSVASSSKTLPYTSTPRSPPQPPVSSFSSPLSSSEWLAPCSRTLSPVPKRAPSPVLPSSSSSFGNPLSLPKPRQPSSEPLASLVPSNPTNLNSKTTEVQVEKDASSIFMLASSSKTLPFVATPPPPTVSSLSSAVSFTESLAPCSRILPPVSTPPPPVSPSSSYSLGRPPSTPPPEQPSSKPLLTLAPPNPTNPNSKTTKVWVEKDPSSVYSLTSSSKTLPSVSTPPPVSSLSSPVSLTDWNAPCQRTLPPVSMPPPPLSSSSLGTPLSTPKPQQPSSKPLLPLAPSNPTNPNSKTTKIWVEKDPSSVYSLTSSSKKMPSVSTPPPPPVSSLSSPVSLTEWNAPCPRTLPPVSMPPPPLSSSSLGTPLSTPKPQQPSSKPLLPLAPSNPNSKTTKIWVEKDPSSMYSLTSSSKTLPSVSTPPPPPVSSLSSPLSLTEWNAPCPRTLPPVSVPPPPPVSPLSSSSLGTPPSIPKPQRPSIKPLLPLAPSNPTNPNSKTTKFWVEKDPSFVYSLPSSSKTLPSVSTPPPPPVSSLSFPVPLTEWNAPCPSTLPHVSVPPPPPVSPLSSSSSSSSSGTPPSTPKPYRPSSKPILSPAPPNPTNTNSKTNYVWVKKDTSSIYAIPKDFKILIKNDVVPEILERPLSPSTYKDYFEALLYAEDFYLEKWEKFEMENVTLELEEASIYKRKGKYNKKNMKNMDDEKDDKLFVTFELDSIPERRPFLLSRDFVFVSPSGTRAEPLQGLIYRVVKSNRVLVEFGEDFHAQHYKACKYDVKFSFNRVCLKRAHQAVATVSDPSFRNLLFPDSLPKNSLLTSQPQSIISKLGFHEISAIRHILSHQNAVPYLVEGPLARTRDVVCEAVLQLYCTSPSCRILICAPTNKGCDDITRSFMGKIPKSDIFRANAAFRELDEVPEDILASCHYKMERECFSCPPIHELENFNVISSTFMSSFRLHYEGIMAGHFSHIFLVGASTIIEPEAMVPLANLANESTVVTVTGAPGDCSGWIRSSIAREKGLLISYFERLRQSKLYDSLDPKVITVLHDLGKRNPILWDSSLLEPP